MKCTKYDDFELGLIKVGDMKTHMVTCPDCRSEAALDECLSSRIESLRRDVDDSGLWNRIETGLLEKGGARGAAMGERASAHGRETAPRAGQSGPAAPEQPTKIPAPRKKLRYFSFLKRLIPGPENLTFLRTAGVTAAVVVTVGLASWFLFLRPSPGKASGLMADAALARVETEEREYAAAIEDLEGKAGTKLAEMDFSLMALYRDRLETIDAQIERCREAIGQNPWNAHIRRYMLAALRDKKDTLGLIMAQQ